MSIDLNSIVILNVHGAGYHCIISGINKKEAVKLLENPDLSQKGRLLTTLIFSITYKSVWSNFSL